MKHLKNFLHFDHESFLKGKNLIYVDGKENKAINGVSITLLIAEDHTNYGDSLDDNQYEKLVIKMPDTKGSYLEGFKRNDKVIVTGVTNAVVWGDYQSNLSITAKVVKPNAQNRQLLVAI